MLNMRNAMLKADLCMMPVDLEFESNGQKLTASFFEASSGISQAGVVLCPPHPKYGGNRRDTRTVRVAEELTLHRISSLCIDYGSYGRGITEVRNVADAISLMQKKTKIVGLLGYSFGAAVASNAAARTNVAGFVAMSILRRVNGLTAIFSFDCPKLFVHGKLDNMASYSDFERLYSEVEGTKQKLVLDTDHYPNVLNRAAEAICKFFQEVCFK
jgi:alpha/beta superfamily hydrolase